MEVIGDQYVMKYTRTRYGTNIGEHVLKKKHVTFESVDDPKKIIMEREMYYVRPGKGRSFYLIPGGYSKLTEFSLMKGQVERYEVWTKKED